MQLRSLDVSGAWAHIVLCVEKSSENVARTPQRFRDAFCNKGDLGDEATMMPKETFLSVLAEASKTMLPTPFMAWGA